MEERASRTVSISQIQTFLLCPLKYRFTYVDHLPKPWRAASLSFGSSIHAAIEWFHKERLAGRTPNPGQVLAVFEADWFAQNLEPLVFPEKESKEELTEKGRQMLSVYLEAAARAKPKAVEESFELDLADPKTGEILEGIRLRGRIDLVEEGETLVDLKTAARSPGNGGLERHLQLSTYALVYLLRHGRIPKLRLDVLLKTKVPKLERLSTSRSLEDLEWTARLIKRVTRAIEARSFYPNPSWLCSECEYFAHCQRWRGP